MKFRKFVQEFVKWLGTSPRDHIINVSFLKVTNGTYQVVNWFWGFPLLMISLSAESSRPSMTRLDTFPPSKQTVNSLELLLHLNVVM